MSFDEKITMPDWVDDLRIGLLAYDPQTGAILDSNRHVERLYGYSVRELRGMELEDYVVNTRRFSRGEAIRRIRAAAEGRTQEFDLQIKCAGDELSWVHVYLTAATLEEKPCVVAEVHEITDRKALERQYRLLSRVVRHNLRNETNVLIGYADRLKAAVTAEALEKQADMILEIATEIGNLSDSIGQIEEIVDPTAALRSPTNIGDVVRTLVGAVGVEYPNAEVAVDARADVWVDADRGLHYALKHALENAISHADTAAQSVDVVITEDRAADAAVVRIIDGNDPIPDVETDVLTGDRPTNSTYHGSGVGLWVMQWGVESLGGELTFERRVPRGNTVCISLPTCDVGY